MLFVYLLSRFFRPLTVRAFRVFLKVLYSLAYKLIISLIRLFLEIRLFPKSYYFPFNSPYSFLFLKVFLVKYLIIIGIPNFLTYSSI